ncbi:MAG: hypothetical protein LBS70_05345 [Candidatus Accumulibacter sp.]|jgi:hypothetical protein|nr:hypothetical protein [Accumulibacter sp.]
MQTCRKDPNRNRRITAPEFGANKTALLAPSAKNPPRQETGRKRKRTPGRAAKPAETFPDPANAPARTKRALSGRNAQKAENLRNRNRPRPPAAPGVDNPPLPTAAKTRVRGQCSATAGYPPLPLPGGASPPRPPALRAPVFNEKSNRKSRKSGAPAPRHQKFVIGTAKAVGSCPGKCSRQQKMSKFVTPRRGSWLTIGSTIHCLIVYIMTKIWKSEYSITEADLKRASRAQSVTAFFVTQCTEGYYITVRLKWRNDEDSFVATKRDHNKPKMYKRIEILIRNIRAFYPEITYIQLFLLPGENAKGDARR